MNDLTSKPFWYQAVKLESGISSSSSAGSKTISIDLNRPVNKPMPVIVLEEFVKVVRNFMMRRNVLIKKGTVTSLLSTTANSVTSSSSESKSDIIDSILNADRTTSLDPTLLKSRMASIATRYGDMR